MKGELFMKKIILAVVFILVLSACSPAVSGSSSSSSAVSESETLSSPVSEISQAPVSSVADSAPPEMAITNEFLSEGKWNSSLQYNEGDTLIMRDHYFTFEEDGTMEYTFVQASMKGSTLHIDDKKEYTGTYSIDGEKLSMFLSGDEGDMEIVFSSIAVEEDMLEMVLDLGDELLKEATQWKRMPR